MAGVRYAVGAVVAGVAVALLTALYNGTPPGLVGAVWYGFPFAWLRRLVVAPQYYPWVIDPAGLVYDVVFWTVVFGVVLLLIMRHGRRDSGTKS